MSPTVAHTIEGYADQASVSPGNAIKFYVNANSAQNSTYKLTIYRLGYYGGAGARQMQTSVTLISVTQALPTPDPTTGLAECNWINPYSLTIPSTWVSGIYVAALVGNTTGEGGYIPFVVKQPSSTAAYVFQTSDTTWQAYNAWGGKSLYAYNSTNGVPAVKVSYSRPLDVVDGLGVLNSYEMRMLYFLEQNGYDVTYQADVDTHAGGAQLLQHKAYLSVGHDEYWSKAMRDNVENARAQGLSLGFLGANVSGWQIRFENSLITGAANRTIVAYKENAANDPIGNLILVTGMWRDPLYANRPENAMVGIMYGYDPVNANIVVTNAAHWVYTGTGLQNGSNLPGLLGYEVDVNFSNGSAPVGLQILAHSPTNLTPASYGDMSIYTQTCSVSPCVNLTATVFATGSMQWAWGLNDYDSSLGLVNTAAQQITHNVLAVMVNPNAALPAIPPNAPNVAPTFVGGTTALTVTQNSPAVDLAPNLHVSDANEGQTETWSQSTAPLHGTLVFSGATASSGSTNIAPPTGSITYKPTSGYSGTDSFTVKVSDGIASATRTFTVTVTASSNVAPVFVGGTTALTVTQNSAAVDLAPNLHVSDTDVGQTETWSQSTAPLHGTLVFSGATASSGSTNIAPPTGSITYKPTSGYSGTDSFTVKVSDGVASVTRTFAVTVTATNLFINPSLELDTDNNRIPDCWQYGGYGTNTATWLRTTSAHSGSYAEKLQITSYTNGDRKLVSSQDLGQSAGGCAPAVQAGANYQVSAYYKSTIAASMILYYLDASNVWQFWKNVDVPAATAWTLITTNTGTFPTGAKAFSFGVAIAGVGTITTDDYSFVQIQ